MQAPQENQFSHFQLKPLIERDSSTVWEPTDGYLIKLLPQEKGGWAATAPWEKKRNQAWAGELKCKAESQQEVC